MSGFGVEPPSECDDFAELVHLNADSPEWDATKIAAAELGEALSEQQMRELNERLRNGMVRGYTSHAFAQWRMAEDKTFKNISEFRRWLEGWRYNGGGEHAFHGCFRIPSDFWSKRHVKSHDWEGSFTAFEGATYADWRTGKFFASVKRYGLDKSQTDNPFDLLAANGILECFAVTFQASDIEALFGHTNPSGKVRGSQYDWEGAIAAFGGAQQKHDLVIDLYAHGAQAIIERWLGDWFASQGPVPAEPTIRPKAKLILNAYKQADKG